MKENRTENAFLGQNYSSRTRACSSKNAPPEDVALRLASSRAGSYHIWVILAVSGSVPPIPGSTLPDHCQTTSGLAVSGRTGVRAPGEGVRRRPAGPTHHPLSSL